MTQVDVSQGTVVRSGPVRDAVAFGRGERAPDRDPSNMMGNVQKVEQLRGMVQRSVELAMADLLKAP